MFVETWKKDSRIKHYVYLTLHQVSTDDRIPRNKISPDKRSTVQVKTKTAENISSANKRAGSSSSKPFPPLALSKKGWPSVTPPFPHVLWMNFLQTLNPLLGLW